MTVWGMVAVVGEATLSARGRVDQAGLCARAGVWVGRGGKRDGSTLKDGAGMRRTVSARRCWRV